jgi:hypothetical protein
MKFLCGNASVPGGAVAGPEALVEDVRWNTTEFVGAIMQPFEAWLVLQFLETLSMRMARHSANAQQVAEFLANHPRVLHVNYPGLPDPLHAPADDHTRTHDAGGARRRGHRRRLDPALRRSGGPGGHHRRPGPGPGEAGVGRLADRSNAGRRSTQICADKTRVSAYGYDTWLEGPPKEPETPIRNPKSYHLPLLLVS